MRYVYNSSKSRCGFTPAMKEFTEKTFKSLEKNLKQDETIKLSMEIAKNGALLLKCRMVTDDNKHILAEVATNDDYYTAIHEMKNKLLRLIRKNKKEKAWIFRPTVNSKEKTWVFRPTVEVEHAEPVENIGKQKMIVMESITPEQAVKELDALGHEWYVFKNRDENDVVCVVYKRFEGDYGLITCK